MRRGFSARASRRAAPGFPTVSAHRPESDCASLFPASGVPTYHPHHGLHHHHDLPLQAPAEAVGKARAGVPAIVAPVPVASSDDSRRWRSDDGCTSLHDSSGTSQPTNDDGQRTTVIARRPRARSDSDMTRRNTPARRCGPRTGKMHRRIGTAHSLYQKPKDST